MAQKVTITKKKTYRQRKVGDNSKYQKCNMCHGTGRVKKGKRK